MTVTTAAALTAALSARATAGGLPALATTAATGIALTATLAALTTTTLAAAGLALPAPALLPLARPRIVSHFRVHCFSPCLKRSRIHAVFELQRSAGEAMELTPGKERR